MKHELWTVFTARHLWRCGQVSLLGTANAQVRCHLCMAIHPCLHSPHTHAGRSLFSRAAGRCKPLHSLVQRAAQVCYHAVPGERHNLVQLLHNLVQAQAGDTASDANDAVVATDVLLRTHPDQQALKRCQLGTGCIQLCVPTTAIQIMC